MIKPMTAITQVHSYIKEHYKPGDVVTCSTIHRRLPWLTLSSVSSALWRLSAEGGILAQVDTERIKARAIKYTVGEDYLRERGFEDRKAPEPGSPRNRGRGRKPYNSSVGSEMA